MEKKKEKSALIRFFSNPFVGFIGSIASVIALIAFTILYFGGNPKRKLTFYCHPVKAPVVKAGHTSSIEIFHEKEKITSDVTAVQVAIWNNGEKSIEKTDILEEFIIYSEPSVPFIDTTIRKVSRDVINLNLNKNFLKDGLIPVSWNILEQNDGGIIQLIFAGGPDTKILAKGIIKEQKFIDQTRYTGKIQSPQEQIKAEVLGRKIGIFLFLIFGLFMAASSIYFYRARKKSEELNKRLEEDINKRPEKEQNKRLEKDIIIGFRKSFHPMQRFFFVISFIFSIVAFILLFIFLLITRTPEPPFGF